jgi:RimJ/RimL family protein N-acetyltransferase
MGRLYDRPAGRRILQSMPARREEAPPIRSPFLGELIRLRSVEEEDLARINELFWDAEVSQHLAMTWPQPISGTRAWWEGARRNPSTAAFAIETLAGELVGVCSLEDVNPRARSAVLGIWVGRPYWDRGYGTDAVRTLCRFGFREMNLQRIGLAVFDTNPRGVRAYEKVGFKEEGRRGRAHFVGGRYVEVIMMGVLAEDLIEP